jgi:hypothetical protein
MGIAAARYSRAFASAGRLKCAHPGFACSIRPLSSSLVSAIVDSRRQTLARTHTLPGFATVRDRQSSTSPDFDDYAALWRTGKLAEPLCRPAAEGGGTRSTDLTPLRPVADMTGQAGGRGQKADLPGQVEFFAPIR